MMTTAIIFAAALAQASLVQSGTSGAQTPAPTDHRERSAAAAKGAYTNPVWNRDFPDPFILHEKGTFYAYGTQNSGEGFQLLTSKNLVDWSAQPAVAKPEWSNVQLWAPEVYRWKGRYMFFYSARDPRTGKRDLAVSAGPTPKGPFKTIRKLVRGADENPGQSDDGAIDPAVFVEKGQPYLLYIREAQPRAIKIIRLSQDLDKTVGKASTLLGVDRPLEGGVLDAPTLIKRDGWYWLFYSSGWFQSRKEDANYRVWAAKSRSLWGPYQKPEKPLLETAPGRVYSPGHQAVFQSPSGEWLVAYHAWSAEGEPLYGRNPQGRTLRIDRLKWTSQGPIIQGPTTEPQPSLQFQPR